MNLKFYICRICNKVFEVLNNTGTETICCGQEMELLVPNTIDASHEKHVPVFEVTENIVSVYVGEEDHPMTPDHYIQWIILETDKGIQKKELKPGDKPFAHFSLLPKEKVIAVYEFCNIHKLWMKKA